MHVRKLVKAGPSSHTVALPKDWLLQHKLAKGSVVYIIENGKGLQITPDIKDAPVEVREKTIDIDKKDINTIGREVTSAYINNYSSIILSGDLRENAKDIRRIIRDFAGLEITEQTTKKLVAQDLLNLQEVSVDKTLRRMDMILRSMIQDSIASLDGEDLYDSVALRDYDVNRMYFLLYRLLKGSLRNPAMAQKLQLASHDALAYSLLVNNLENVGDAAKNACSACKELGAKERTPVKAAYQLIEGLYLDAMKAQFTNDRTLADNVAQRRREIVEKVSSLVTKQSTPGLVEVVDVLKGMTTLIADIARGVIDRE
jgi:phosphate uptake regulator